jgi:exopolysaccharide biosynthesis protein
MWSGLCEFRGFKKMKSYLIQLTGILLSVIITYSAHATPYQYERRKVKDHVIHIVTLNSTDYDVQFVKAHNQVFGRETVDSIALRSDGDIAINAGFFEIGQSKDGMPSGTLIVDGKIMGLKSQKHVCLIKQNDQLSIKNISNTLQIKVEDKFIPIHKVNQFPEKNSVVLYSSHWGPSTLTNFKNRKEVAVDRNYNVIATYEHGNVDIPKEGYVISFPSSAPINLKELKTPVDIDFSQSLFGKKDTVSAVMGIPYLIEEGRINGKLSKHTDSHARTAIGLKPNGDIVIVVAEHVYTKPLADITLGEVKAILKNNKDKLSIKYKKELDKLNVSELKEIVQKEFTVPHKAVGLTLLELATFMQELGCHSALNLDGGGSSTLWIEGKIVNQTVGDKDEGIGQSLVRPVSDALVFKKKS